MNIFRYILVISFLLFYLNSKTQTNSIDSLVNLTYSELNQNLYQNKKIISSTLELESITDANKIILLDKLLTIEHLLGNFEEVSSISNEIISINEKNDNQIGIALQYYGQGWRLKDIDLNKADELVKKSINLLDAIDPQNNRLSEIYDNYGVIQERKGNLKEALTFYKKSLQLKEELNDSIGIPYSLQKMAVNYAKQGELQKSKEALSKSIITAKNDSLALAETYAYAGDISIIANDYFAAIQNFDESLKISDRKNYTYLVKYNLEQIANAYKELNKPDLALDYYLRYSTIKDSIVTTDAQRSLTQLQVAFDTTQKEKEIESLNQQNSIKDLRSKIALSGLLLTLLGLVVLGLLKNRQSLKHRTELKQAKLNQLQAVITAEESERERIARELHDGVGQMIAATKMTVSVLGDSIAEDDQSIHQSALEMIDQSALEIRSISHELLPVNLQNKSIFELIDTQINRINQSKKIDIEWRYDEGIAFSDELVELHLLRIIQELLKNGVKHSESDKIFMELMKVNNGIEFTYKDWGKGFEKELVEKSKGIGWKNITERLTAINANLKNIDVEKGTHLLIKIPS